MKYLRIISVTLAYIALLTSAAFAQTSGRVSTIYTDLTAEKCKTIEASDEGAGYYRGICPGVGGYKLEVLEGDIRQTINVIAPSGKKSELNFWTNVSSAFSSVGDKAEWRVRKSGKNTVPFALIVRFNSSDSSGETQKNISRLIIIKIKDDLACITDVVEPMRNANKKAREVAYASNNKPCKFETSKNDDQLKDSVSSIDAYAKTVDEFVGQKDGPDTVIADISDFEKDTKAEWKKFNSREEFEKSETNSYETAFVWNKNGNPISTNITYSSPSGDWAQYVFYIFREDGSVAKATRELRTFMGDIIVIRKYYYDKSGALLKETRQFKDLETKKFIKAPKSFEDIDVDIYKSSGELPFASMLGSGNAAGNNDESRFIPKGWKLEQKDTGDLNEDKIDDLILQIRNENPENEDQDRRLIILFKNRSGKLTKIAQNDTIIRCSTCGGMLGGGPADIKVQKGVLLIEQMYGSRSGANYLYRLRYETSTNRFRLIGEDVTEFDRLELASEETSTNYLTGKQVIKISKGGENDVKETVTRKTVSKKKRYLSDVTRH
ncbi:MAG: hypothetical protein HKN25_13875 [Pyrinomonadaceae bacterium]|nr:hypothetical protein [Pyrinomonadaceae bacterium]